VTHLLFNNVGSHGEWDDESARELFHARFRRLAPLASELGMPFVQIDSNLAGVLRIDFRAVHITSNVAAVLCLQGLFGRYPYASGHTYSQYCIEHDDPFVLAEPALMPVLSTESLEVIATGSQYARTEKTEHILAIPSTRQHLNVCVRAHDGGRNCSACDKCCRTLLTLELLGRLDEFEAAFDLDAYRRARWLFVLQVLTRRRSGTHDEILELATDRGIRFPLWKRVLGRILGLAPRGLRLRVRGVRRLLRS
jgi:hypothetical protein